MWTRAASVNRALARRSLINRETYLPSMKPTHILLWPLQLQRKVCRREGEELEKNGVNKRPCSHEAQLISSNYGLGWAGKREVYHNPLSDYTWKHYNNGYEASGDRLQPLAESHKGKFELVSVGPKHNSYWQHYEWIVLHILIYNSISTQEGIRSQRAFEKVFWPEMSPGPSHTSF